MVVLISVLFFTGFKRKISSCPSVPSWRRSIRWSPVSTPPTLLTIPTPHTTPSVTPRLLSPPSIWSFRVRGLSCLHVVALDSEMLTWWWRTDPCGKCPCRGLQIWFPIVHVYWNLMDLLKWPLGGMKVILKQNWDFIRSVVPYWINAVLEWPPLDLVQLLLCWFSWLLIESFYDGLSHFQVDCYIFLDFMYI